VNHTKYPEEANPAQHPAACTDCHDPQTMQLRVTCACIEPEIHSTEIRSPSSADAAGLGKGNQGCAEMQKPVLEYDPPKNEEVTQAVVRVKEEET
jgi:hypothetical protein